MKKLILAFSIAVLPSLLFAKESISFEAENGLFSSFVRVGYDSQASGDLYVFSNSTNTTVNADYFFHNIATGNYVLWGRVYPSDASHDQFVVSMDTGTDFTYHAWAGTRGWQWFKASFLFTLDNKLHGLHLKLDNSSAAFDRLVLTNDFSLSSTTLNGTILFHPCPTVPSGSDACIQNIIQYQIKPIYESSLSDMEKCRQINDLIRRKIDPLTAQADADFMHQLEISCSTCNIREIKQGCPWQ